MKQNINDFESSEEMDPLEEANKRFLSQSMSMPALKEMGDASVAEEVGQFGDAGSSRIVKATPKKPAKASPTPAPKAESKPAPKAAPVDVTKLSVAERRKLSRENPSVGGPTDKRSVNQRIKEAFGMKSGGMTASRRGDGIAQRGKTRGKMC